MNAPACARVPPVLAPARGGRAEARWWHWLGGAALAATALALLHGQPPRGQFFYPRCTFHAMTGLHCPGCGATRSLHALLHGDLAGAARANALLVAALPIGAWWAGRAWWRASKRRPGRWLLAERTEGSGSEGAPLLADGPACGPLPGSRADLPVGKGAVRRFGPVWVWALLAFLLLFTVLRNLPFGPFRLLAP